MADEAASFRRWNRDHRISSVGDSRALALAAPGVAERPLCDNCNVLVATWLRALSEDASEGMTDGDELRLSCPVDGENYGMRLTRVPDEGIGNVADEAQ